MRTINWLLFAAIGSTTLYLSSCKKTDHQLGLPGNAPSSIEERFFRAKENLEPEIKSLMEFVRRKDSKNPFIEKTVAKIGYPHWDKPLKTRKQPQTLSVKVNGIKSNGTATPVGGVDVYYIPFTRDSQNFVNAAMIIKVSPKDTSIDYICDWQYRRKEHGSATGGNTAERHALFFMLLDNHTLGHTEFNISDISLFPAAYSPLGSKKIKLLPKSSDNTNGKKDQVAYYEECTDYYVCGCPECCAYYGGCDYMHCSSPPGSPTYCYLALEICQSWWQYDDDDYGGGGSGIPPSDGSGGGEISGGGSVPPDPCNTGYTPPPIYPDKSTPQSGGYVKVNSPQNDCNNNPGWSPEPVLTTAEKAIFDDIDNEDILANSLINGGCHGTNRTGNIQWPGTLEHWIIMANYVLEQPQFGEAEFRIPGASGTGSGYAGYADIANTMTGELFEIKPNTSSGITQGRAEVENYVLKANEHCPLSSNAISSTWKKGYIFPTKYYQAKDPNSWLQAEKTEDGLILYSYVGKNTIPTPVPVAIPQTIIDKIAKLVQKLKGNLSNADAVIGEFFRDPNNADLLNYIKAAGIATGAGIIIGTIIQDFATLGTGIVDDWSSFYLAYRIIRYSIKL